MIAKVRIAPIEQWCKRLRENASEVPELLNFVGMEVEINPASMKVESTSHDLDCRWWKLSDKSKAEMCGRAPKLGERSTNYYICEHMLEMD